MKALPSLGEQENEILRYISQSGEISVREVADHFEKQKGLARTTILTVMERLRNKGFLRREKIDGIYKYSEKIEAETVMKGKVNEFIERTLGGSLTPLINHFAGHKVSADEIEKLRAIVAEFDKKKGGR
ncbi:Penicillinase repressor [compost metagenome]